MIPQVVRDWLQDCEDIPLTPKSLKELEADLNVELPKDYAKFLLQFNGGEFRKSVNIEFPSPNDLSEGASLRAFLGVPAEVDSDDGMASVIDYLDRELAAEWLPIVECDPEGFIILKFRGPGRRGYEGVWHWVPPFGPGYEEPPRFVAKTFTGFLQMIEIPEEEDPSDAETQPLFVALERGSLTTIEQHLSKGGDPNVRNERGVPLLGAAAKYQWPQIVRLLLENSADPNARDIQGQTPLHLAAPWSLDSLKLLVAAGADTSVRDKQGIRAADIEYMPPRNREFLSSHTT